MSNLALIADYSTETNSTTLSGSKNLNYSAIFEGLSSKFGFKPRSSQLTLAQQIKETLRTGGICCIEAPTGTGKTLGYLAGALDAQAHHRVNGNEVPLVISTATIGLQNQIIKYDVPMLAKIGAVDPSQVALAKGRNRYFCPRVAGLLETKKGAIDTQFDMFDEDKKVDEAGIPIALDMLYKWREGKWDGDKDSWGDSLPDCWESHCGASSETCVQRSCDHYESCPYMRSRQKLSQAKLIIANHDIVLADLAARADEDDSSTVLPLKAYSLVVDEAHNLPEKATSTLAASACLSALGWLSEMPELAQDLLRIPEVVGGLRRGVGVSSASLLETPELLQVSLQHLLEAFTKNLRFTSDGIFSWGLKSPDYVYLTSTQEINVHATELLTAFNIVVKSLSDRIEDSVGIERVTLINLMSRIHPFRRYLSKLQATFSLFCSGEELVRWVSKTAKGDIYLSIQPLEGAEVLDRLLWQSGFPVALVSATLQVGGSFDRFRAKSGLPAHAVTKALPAVFDYSRGYFHQPRMKTEPGDEGHDRELSLAITALYKKEVGKGMLILFTAYDSMRTVVGFLPREIRSRVLMQGDRPLPELIELHKSRIDKGERSILVGVNSLSEGLDLPGDYCKHVVIARLPFGQPGHPVEAARREKLGSSWFTDAYLADMLTALIQSTGRLIRRESDYGVISLLDSRLSKRRYGAAAFYAMPGFSRGIKISDYEKMLADGYFTVKTTKQSSSLTLVIDNKKPSKPPQRKDPPPQKQKFTSSKIAVVGVSENGPSPSPERLSLAQKTREPLEKDAIATIPKANCSIKPPNLAPARTFADMYSKFTQGSATGDYSEMFSSSFWGFSGSS